MTATPLARPRRRRHFAASAEPLLSGWLTKRAVSAVLLKNWRRRWIVLWPQRIEWHREPDPAGPALGELRISAATQLRKSDAWPHCLVVRHCSRELHIQASSAEEAQGWFDAINDAIHTRVIDTPTSTGSGHLTPDAST